MPTVIEEISFPLPMEAPEALSSIIDLCLEILKDVEEPDVFDWAKKIKDDISSDEIMTAFVKSFDLSCKMAIDELEGYSESEVPVVIAQVVSELGWLKKRLKDKPQDIQKNLGLSEIALDSWKDLCEGHPVAKIAISTVRELVQVAKLLRGGESVTAQSNDNQRSSLLAKLAKERYGGKFIFPGTAKR